jgi:hypothetical protein
MIRGAQRMAFPTFEGDELIELIKELLRVDERWSVSSVRKLRPNSGKFARPHMTKRRTSVEGPTPRLARVQHEPGRQVLLFGRQACLAALLGEPRPRMAEGHRRLQVWPWSSVLRPAKQFIMPTSVNSSSSSHSTCWYPFCAVLTVCRHCHRSRDHHSASERDHPAGCHAQLGSRLASRARDRSDDRGRTGSEDLGEAAVLSVGSEFGHEDPPFRERPDSARSPARSTKRCRRSSTATMLSRTGAFSSKQGHIKQIYLQKWVLSFYMRCETSRPRRGIKTQRGVRSFSASSRAMSIRAPVKRSRVGIHDRPGRILLGQASGSDSI